MGRQPTIGFCFLAFWVVFPQTVLLPKLGAAVLVGEATRTLDDRHRLTLPTELADGIAGAAETADCLLTKERPGCLSLWPLASRQKQLDAALELVRAKLNSGRLVDRIAEVQRVGRLLSTRNRQVQLAGRGRLVIPDGFREFLGVEPGGTVVVVGAAVCVELWRPEAWTAWIGGDLPEFEIGRAHV